MLDLFLLDDSKWLDDWMRIAFDTDDYRDTNVHRAVIDQIRDPISINWVRGHYYGYRDGDRLIGSATLKESAYDTHQSLSLWNIAIDPNSRGHGHGRTLLEATWAETQSHGRHFLLTYTDSGARGFYHSCGFNEYGHIPGFLENGTEDRVFFYKAENQ